MIFMLILCMDGLFKLMFNRIIQKYKIKIPEIYIKDLCAGPCLKRQLVIFDLVSFTTIFIIALFMISSFITYHFTTFNYYQSEECLFSQANDEIVDSNKFLMISHEREKQICVKEDNNSENKLCYWSLLLKQETPLLFSVLIVLQVFSFILLIR